MDLGGRNIIYLFSLGVSCDGRFSEGKIMISS